jgi:predicted ATPase
VATELSDAARLFVDRATAAGVDVDLSPDSALTIEEICCSLEGMPLAIELAAARRRVFGLAEIQEGLSDRLDLLAGGPRLVVARHRAMRASIEWSYQLLSVDEQMLLGRLSIFAGGWTSTAMSATCAGQGLNAQALPDLLRALVDKSMIVADTAGRQARFRLLEVIRQFAAEHLHGEETEPGLSDRHLVFFTALADRADRERWCLDRPGRSRLDPEWPNLNLALRHACVAQPAVALEMVGHLGESWRECGGSARA